MFKVLILAARHTVSDERMEFLIRDRLSWLRFLGFDLGAPTPDRNTIWSFRERLVRAGAMDDLFAAFDGELRRCGYLAMGGQIVDATLVSASKQRNSNDEKAAIKAGKSAVEIWPDQPAKAAQKDTDARWTLKTGRRKNPAGRNGACPTSRSRCSAIKNHIVIDRAYGFIRGAAVTDAARHDGKMLRHLVTSDNLSRRRVGGQCLSLEGEQGVAGGQGPGLPHPPQEAAGPGNAQGDRPGQCPQVSGPCACGARLRSAEGSHGRVHPYHRAQAGGGQDRPRQPGLQFAASDLP